LSLRFIGENAGRCLGDLIDSVLVEKTGAAGSAMKDNFIVDVSNIHVLSAVWAEHMNKQ
jgi:hypothetical protein